MHSAMRYSAMAPGKRIRPALCMASCKAVGGSEAAALDAGCACELVHCFSLIHDDLPAIDDDDLRRGVPTCHIEFGEAMAILAGDALFALAFEVVSRCSSDTVAATEATRILASSTGSYGLVGGEVLDILSEGTLGGIQDLETIHARKTGALIGAACRLGALLGGADLNTCELMERTGMSIGLAFQITDDVLNETSTSESLGKAAGTDRERSKLTYPSVIGLQASQDLSVQMVERALRGVRGLPGDSSELDAIARYATSRDR